MPKSFAALVSLSDRSYLSASETSKLMSLPNTSFDALQMPTLAAFLLGFF